MILFGSRARGEATRDSDIDLLVIVDDDTPPEKMTWKARHEARRSYPRRRIFPIRAEIFERDRAIVDTLAAEADADGIVVYGSPKESCMKPATRVHGGRRSNAGFAWPSATEELSPAWRPIRLCARWPRFTANRRSRNC